MKCLCLIEDLIEFKKEFAYFVSSGFKGVVFFVFDNYVRI